MGDAVRRQLHGSIEAFREVAGNRPLRRLESAWATATFAYSGLNVVVVVYGYEHGGTAAVGAMALLRVLPGALASPFTSVLADRYRRERVLLTANVSRTLLVGIAAASAIAGGASWIVYVLTAAVGIAGSNFRPAQAALLPRLARTPEQLTAANVVASTIQAMGLLVAPAVAGVLVGSISTGAGFILVGGLFLVSTALVLLIEAPEAGEADRERKREPLVPRLLAGFGTLASDSRLRLVFGFVALQTFVAGALAVMNVLVAIDLLLLGKAGVGYLTSAVGIGGLVGSLVAAALVGRARLAPPFIVGIFVWSLPLALLAALPYTAVALAGWGVIGVANMISDVAGFTLVQRTTPDPVLARVFGILEMAMYTAMALGSITAPAVISGLGIRGSLALFGLLLPAAAVVLGPRVVALDRVAIRPGDALELLRPIPMFAALPAMTLEQLAAHMKPIELPQGATILTQGEHADRFYVVAEGEAEVLVDGSAVRRVTGGGYFGEIGLLRDVPRTASVIAVTDVRLMTLDGAQFVPAVSGDRASSEEADVVISERLGIASAG